MITTTLMIVLTLMKAATAAAEEDVTCDLDRVLSVTFTQKRGPRRHKSCFTSIQIRRRRGGREGDMLGWFPQKGRKARRHLAPSDSQPWHVLLKDGGVFELDPFDEIGARRNRDGRISFV